jgi:hypothetical protein
MINFQKASLRFWQQVLHRHLKPRKNLTQIKDSKVSWLATTTTPTTDKGRQAVAAIARLLELPEKYTLSLSEVEEILVEHNLYKEREDQVTGQHIIRDTGRYALCTQASMKELRVVSRKSKLANPKMLKVRTIAEDIVQLAKDSGLAPVPAAIAFPHLYVDPVNSIF